MKKNKFVIIYSGAKYWGGVETYLLNLFLAKSNHEFILISMGEWELTEKIRATGHEVVVFSTKRISLRTIQGIKKYIDNNNIDLVAAGGLVASTYARIVSLLTNKPCVITIHSTLELDYPNKFIYTIYFLINKFSRWQTTKYIAVSKYLQKYLIQSGVKKKKIEVVYNGLEDIGEQPEKRTSEVILGSIGRLHHVKGYHNLIKAASLLKDENFKLIIWGDGEEKEELLELIRRENLSDKVSLAGRTEDIKIAFAQTDIYIQPSLMEGFGLTVVEAMLAEKPVIVTPKGSLPELISDGKTGLVAGGTQPEALAASLKVLINDQKLAENLAKNARKEALEKYSLEKFQKETLRVFEETAR